MADHGKSVFDMDANVVALLCYVLNFVCYLGLVLSIIVIIQDKTNKLARFHAWQSILLLVVPVVLTVVLTILSFVGIMIDAVIGFPIFTLITTLLYLLLALIGLLVLVGVILAAIKAVNGEIYKLPVVGNMAEKYAGV
ncbi:MAG: hypothetical protein DWQ47_01360 [Acidobacteria bacterium]|nr:MAG: hypothetical protein DWQ32_11820 [Acidobacteriota bacterium]REK04148.1 MAG: hypothetical protein DWQ38_01345 [Acidobacteriota bacterium]REK15310.1 MAG: hypothetical protein DWQ43_17510 [Acidobacteriota bacterium]REK46400.1 MAG: hypothetical protein DWQ47_01360 [Acidobacteriota bacterium]